MSLLVTSRVWSASAIASVFATRGAWLTVSSARGFVVARRFRLGTITQVGSTRPRASSCCHAACGGPDVVG